MIDMKIKFNSHLDLTLNDIEYVVKNFIRPNYPGCNFIIKGSEQTNDIMVFIETQGRKGRVIFTDKTDALFKYHYISPNATIADVVKILETAMKQILLKNDEMLIDL